MLPVSPRLAFADRTPQSARTRSAASCPVEPPTRTSLDVRQTSSSTRDCVEPYRQSRNPSFFVGMARVEALRSGGFCCPRLHRYVGSEEARFARWPPSAAQTARTVFPYAAFTMRRCYEMQATVLTEEG